MQGLRFTDGERELRQIVPMVRAREHVDAVVVLSEQELANNVRLAATIPGIDAMLSADMHERTMRPIVVPTGTRVVEEGADGAMVGELTLLIVRGRVIGSRWTAHIVGDQVADDPAVAARVAEVRAPFVRGARFDGLAREAIGAHRIGHPIDEVVGFTDVALDRAGHTDDSLPASVEGTAHDLIADAMRETTGADVAMLRGFRFGTELPPGPITREALYHWLPLGGAVARVEGVPGATLERLVQRSVDGAFDPDARRWTGGWLAAFSGLTFDLDLDRPAGSRATNLRVRGHPLDRSGRTTYSLAGLWFADEPETVNACAPCAGGRVRVVRGDAREPLDAVEVVARWLASRPASTARVRAGRVRLVRPLPRPAYGFPVMQPLGVARARPDS
jgi:2',3'-cyclic-nucleotide 2'-phosphodiesterase (5'-nucleotidase family)